MLYHSIRYTRQLGLLDERMRPKCNARRCLYLVSGTDHIESSIYQISIFRKLRYIKYRTCFALHPHPRVFLCRYNLNENSHVSYIESHRLSGSFFVHRYRIEVDSHIDIRYPISNTKHTSYGRQREDRLVVNIDAWYVSRREWCKTRTRAAR